jgi:hypothetical protein
LLALISRSRGSRSKNILDLYHQRESSKQLSQKGRHPGPATYSVEITLMYNYPALECLVAFAIVFLIGYLVGNSGGRQVTATPGTGVASP